MLTVMLRWWLGIEVRNLYICLAVFVCSCQAPHDELNLHVRRHSNFLIADVFSDRRACFITYRIFYKRLGLIPVYGKRPGIDIRGECEIDIPAGKSTAKFNIEDASFNRDAAGKNLCVDVTYHLYPEENKVTLKHKTVCE